MRRERGAAALSDMKGAPLISLISPRPLSGGPNASQAHFSHAGTQTARHSFSLVTKWVYIIYQWGREKCKRKESFLILWLRHKAGPFIHGLFALTSPPHPAELLLSFTCSASCKHTVPEKNDHSKDHFDLTNHASPLGHHKIQHKVFALRTCARYLTHRSKI